MKSRRNKWTALRESVSYRCDALTRDVPIADAPVALRRVVEACGIRRVEFRPMLVDGGLAIDGDGFIMFINCEADNVAIYKQKYLEEDGRSLPNRVRFTIAHELVHTFFYDRAGPIPKSKLLKIQAKELDSLESACDMGANELLVPPRVLQSKLDQERELSLDVVRRFAKEFAVSLETLLIALESLESWGRHDAFIALLTAQGRSFTVKTTAADPITKQCFSQFQRNQQVNVEQLGIDALEGFGGREQRINWVRRCRIGSIPAEQPFVAMCETISLAPRRLLLFLKATGDARAIG
jgi:Zn-dependent peptidase ImmA (M78 family)